MYEPEYAISIDLGGTKCAAALIADDGTLNHLQSVKYGAGDRVDFLINTLIKDLISDANSRQYRIAGIGVSVPGISYVEKGTVWAPNIKGWEEYPLRQSIKDHLSVTDLPVRIESDRGCSILGESWMGAATGSDHAIFLAVGTGIGAGILVNGQIIRGLNDIAGAIGWMALERPFHKKLSPFGNFEYFASGDGLVRAAREYLTVKSSELINNKTIKDLRSEDLFNAYEKGDLVAEKVFEQAIELWGMASANLVSLFNPEVIIFGGGVFGPGTQFLGRIYEEAKKWAQPIAIQQVQFLESQLKGNAPLLGAAYMVFKNLTKKSNL